MHIFTEIMHSSRKHAYYVSSHIYIYCCFYIEANDFTVDAMLYGTLSGQPCARPAPGAEKGGDAVAGGF